MIKNYCIFLFFAFCMCACSSKTMVPLTAEVNAINEIDNKVIVLRSVGFGSTIVDAEYNAEKKAFEIIFFRGIPNTSIERPLVGFNENQLQLDHADYFNEFFSNRYKSFVMSLEKTTPTRRNRGVTSAGYTIKINLLSLRRDLEDRKIIRKFGL